MDAPTIPGKMQSALPSLDQCYYSLMEPSGFVLAGGLSSRMGRDKALLPYRGKTLVEHVAETVSEALPESSRPVAIIGDPGRYGNLGYPVHPDSVPGCGPLEWHLHGS